MSKNSVFAAIERNATNHRRTLKLNNRRLTSIPDELCELTHLEHVEMYRNRLADLPAAFSKLTSLRHLDLSDNDFDHIPDPLFELRELSELLMPANDLAVVPDGIGDLHNLVTLRLGGVRGAISPALGSLPLLEVLAVEASTTGALPAQLGDLRRLRILALDGSLLDEFPPWICGLDNLEVLTLRGCGLTEIPEEVGALRSLRILDLSGNDLPDLPEALFDLEALHSLDLYDNPRLPIIDLPTRLPNLTSASQGELGAWFFGPGDQGELEVLEDPDHDAPFLLHAFLVDEPRRFIGLMTTTDAGWLVESADGQSWTEVPAPGSTSDANVAELWQSDGALVTVVTTPSEDGTRRRDPMLAVSGDGARWSTIDLSSHLREDEALGFSGAAISNGILVATGYRSPRSGSETSVLLVGPMDGPLQLVRPPTTRVDPVIASPEGFILAAPSLRGAERTRLFRSTDGTGWSELDALDGRCLVYRVGAHLLANDQGLLWSSDWGVTWAEVELDFGASDVFFTIGAVGPAGVALDAVVRAESEDRYAQSVWFSGGGHRFTQLLAEPRGSNLHIDVVAVADDYVLVRRRDVESGGPIDWLRVPVPSE